MHIVLQLICKTLILQKTFQNSNRNIVFKDIIGFIGIFVKFMGKFLIVESKKC